MGQPGLIPWRRGASRVPGKRAISRIAVELDPGEQVSMQIEYMNQFR